MIATCETSKRQSIGLLLQVGIGEIRWHSRANRSYFDHHHFLFVPRHWTAIDYLTLALSREKKSRSFEVELVLRQRKHCPCHSRSSLARGYLADALIDHDLSNPLAESLPEMAQPG